MLYLILYLKINYSYISPCAIREERKLRPECRGMRQPSHCFSYLQKMVLGVVALGHPVYWKVAVVPPSPLPCIRCSNVIKNVTAEYQMSKLLSFRYPIPVKDPAMC